MTTTAPLAPITHRRVVRIALPIMLSSATVPLVGVVDTAAVGQTGDAVPIGAVGIGAVILSTAYWIFGFLRMGTTGLVGQAEGANDADEVSAILSRALLVAVMAGGVLIFGQSGLFALAFWGAPASAEVETLAREYTSIRIWSSPAAIAVYALTGWLIAMERTGAVLAMQIAMNGMNIVLDFWFVRGLGWGVSGVASATVIAELTGAALGLWFCRAAFARPAWRDRARILDTAHLTRLARISNDILIRSAGLLAIFTSFTFLGARFGDVTLAANQVLMQFIAVSAYALDGFAHAAETLVARAVGRRDVAHVRRAGWMCALWAGVAAVLTSALFAVAGGAIIDLMTTAPEVRDAARTYLPWVALSPLLGVWAFILDGIFIGATRGPDLRNMMAVSLAIYIAAVLLLMPPFANHGLWAAILISFLARSVTLGARYPALERDLVAKPATA